MKHLLFVEDDAFLRNIINSHLLNIGYHVDMAINLQSAKNMYANHVYDMILLDITLPDGNGFDWAKELLAVPNRIPILFLTSHTSTSDVKLGFELGASDYLKKPFDMEEMAVRIKHILKDFNTGAGQERRIGDYIYNPATHLLSLRGVSCHLGQLQGVVLNELSATIGQVVIKDELLQKYWGEANYFTSKNLDSVIVKLRQHFKEDARIRIAALKRRGYQLMVTDEL
jgi:DNA-binding response OmpR family regulator